jgi:hypothetical protein
MATSDSVNRRPISDFGRKILILIDQLPTENNIHVNFNVSIFGTDDHPCCPENPQTICSVSIMCKGKGKVVPVLNWAPRNEGVLGEWR